MSPKSSGHIPVVDVDQAFPTLVGTPAGSGPVALADQGPQVRAAIRDVLGVRSRAEDPQAFTDALTAAFRLVPVEGHIKAEFVPRGYAIQSDLGAITGGQASLYRRATIARTEILRILDGLTPLRVDGDVQDMDGYRLIVRNAVQKLVDELGAPGGPRIAMVNSYFSGLLGRAAHRTPDNVGGQLGALRERFGLIDDNVNTVEEEGVRTSFWTLVDMVSDLSDAWQAECPRFTGTAGAGFLGTSLIRMSRLMDAASDQVDELEAIFDSVMLSLPERRTIILSKDENLTLDGLLSWLRAFLSDEGRRLAQDAGRDGIVAALAPTAIALDRAVRELLSNPIKPEVSSNGSPFVRYLRSGSSLRWPPGMFAARVEIAVDGLSRLLWELARQARGIGRYAEIVLIEADLTPLKTGEQTSSLVNVDVRAMNVRPQHVPCFVRAENTPGDETESAAPKYLKPLGRSATVDEDTMSAVFDSTELGTLLEGWSGLEGILAPGPARIPASHLPLAVLDRETGRIVHAPEPKTWPRLVPAGSPSVPPVSNAQEAPSQNDDGDSYYIDEYENGLDLLDGNGSPPADGPGGSSAFHDAAVQPAATPTRSAARKSPDHSRGKTRKAGR